MQSIDNAHLTLHVLAEQVAARTDRSGECWIWTGYIDPRGYGRLQVGNRSRGVHRVAYEVGIGPIPDGYEIDHRCHTRSCVRPEHLQAVTTKQNQENRSGPQANSTSGVLGVTWDRQKSKWRAKVRHNGRTHNVGLFAALREAETAVIAKRNELFTNNLNDHILHS